MGRPSTLPTVAQARPELVSDWHPDNPKTPEQVSIGAKYRAHWKCRNIITYRGQPRPCGYEWTNAVQNRAQAGQGCPACAGKQAHDWNNLAELHPRLIPEWAPTNTLTAYQVTPGSGYKATWVCLTCTHTWVTTVDKRVGRGDGCPDCSVNGNPTTTNNFAILGYPLLIREWHPTKNPKTPDQYRPRANVTVWWKCSNNVPYNGTQIICGHEYEQSINVRYRGVGCPACSGHVATIWNNIPYTNPELIIDWHEDNTLRPENVTRGQHDIIKWRCHNTVDKFGKQETCGHVWNTEVYQRAQGKGCPACCGHAVTEWNCAAARHSYLIPQWSPENIKTPYEVTSGSMYRVTWVCDTTIALNGLQVTCGHQWKTRTMNRISGTGCPECMLWSTSKDEIHLAHELALFYTVENTGRRIQGATQKWKTDIVLPDLNIIVEYDGSYWHRDKTERDLRKSIDLTATGWTVIRAREHPLEPLTPNDILCTTGNHKDTANQVLKQIESFTGQPINGLSDYLLEPDTQNGEAALQRATELRANVLSNRAKRRATTSG